MKTSLGNEGRLSQGQITRLGGLIALVCGRTPYDHILQDLIENELIDVVISEKGQRELTRLTSMAGLRQEQYAETLSRP
ncbi:MAG: hypothetical protein ACPG4J_01430 [Lentibacter algarum]